MTAVEELSIGGTGGPGSYEFGAISGLALHTDGRIAVLDAQAGQVRIFADDGTFVYAVGRTGAGPGELGKSACCLALDGANRLWVRDNGNARYNVYVLNDASGQFLRSVRMSHADVNRWAPVTFDGSGNVIDIGTRTDLANATDNPTVARMHVDSTGAVLAMQRVHAAPAESLSLHKVTREIEGGVATRYLWQPYGAIELVAHSPRGEYAYALTSRYAITWFDDAGKIVREVRYDDIEGPVVTAAERTQAEERIAQDARWAQVTPASLPFGVPDRKPPLLRMFFDAEGRLWVQLSAAEREPRRADVYSPDGRPLFTAEWPANIDFSLGAIRGDIAIGVARDSLDVPRVVRARFRAGVS